MDPNDRARERRIFALSGKLVFADGEPVDWAGALLVAAQPTPVVLASGFASEQFDFLFPRDAWDPTGSGSPEPPDVTIVFSVGEPLVPVLRREVTAAWYRANSDLGTVVLPLRKGDVPIAVPGVESVLETARVRRIRLDDEIVQFAAMAAAGTVEILTGWSGLESVRIEVVDDFVLQTLNRMKAALGRNDFAPHELERINRAGQSLALYAQWDSYASTIYLHRDTVEGESLGFLISLLSHELTHAGQTKNHPELEALYRTELAKCFHCFLSDQPNSEESEIAMFGIMANLEGYAAFVQLAALSSGGFTDICSLTKESRSTPKNPEPVVSAHPEIEAVKTARDTPSLESILRSEKITQYEAGRQVYCDRVSAEKTLAFDPALRPLPILGPTLLRRVEKHALGGNMLAQAALGDLYRTGALGVRADRVKALRWYRLAAGAGSIDAQAWIDRLT